MIHKNTLTDQEKSQKEFYAKQFKTVQTYSLVPWQKMYIKRIKESMLKGNYKNKTLIDIGTGSGYVAIEMAKLGLNVIACDLSAEAIANLKKHKKKLKLKNLKLLVCRAQEIPLKDKAVDYLVANALLEHVPDEEKVIAEWKRILKINGSMFITTPLKFRYIWPFFIPINFVYDKWIGHLRRYDLGTFKMKFQLPVTKVYYTGHFKKMIWVLLTKIKKSSKTADEIELEDSTMGNRVYGASNIIVVLKKNKI